MIEIPKIAVKRLAAELPLEAAHPDAEILSSFVEQVLGAEERESVLAHLALCGSCREVVALAMPEVGVLVTTELGDKEHRVGETVGVGASARRKVAGERRYQSGQTKFSLSRFLVPNLRWAALAAGVVLAAALAMVRSGNLNFAKLQNGSGAPSAITSAPAVSDPSSDRQQPGSETSVKPDISSPVKHETSSPQQATDRIAGRTKKREHSNAVQPTGVQLSKNPLPEGQPQPTELAKVLPAPSTSGGASSSDDVRPIVRAKAPQEARSGSTTNSEIWTVTNGVLQRSSDAGQTWKDALPASHQILCYANQGNQIWAGGKQGILFYSADNGSTWSPMQPNFQGNPLASDVLNIELHGTAEIILSTSNNSTWTSSDGGQTWQRK
jgi:hypothetical protein